MEAIEQIGVYKDFGGEVKPYGNKSIFQKICSLFKRKIGWIFIHPYIDLTGLDVSEEEA